MKKSTKTNLQFILAFLCNLLPLLIFGQTNIENSREDFFNNYSRQTSFIKNSGQFTDVNGNNSNLILYKAKTAGADLYIRRSGFSYVNFSEEQQQVNDNTPGFDIDKIKATNINLQRIDVDFLNSNPSAFFEETLPLPGYFNYYLSSCKDGVTNATGFRKISMKNIYDGIDVIYHGGKESAAGGGLKYDIVVKSGSDPGNIAMKYSGCDKLELEDGALKISSSIGNTITEYIPKVYQIINGKIKEIKTGYILENNIVRFNIQRYDKAYDLIIDPWATYYGGSGKDAGYGITVDPNNGSVFITGFTRNTGLPVSPGAFQLNNAGAEDAFVAKFDKDGFFQWATYFGGSGADNGDGIAADQSGNVIITGYTSSGAAGALPVTAGAFQNALAGSQDAFLAKFNSAGSLMWCTYYGGTGDDHGYAIAMQGNDIVFTGNTKSVASFPVSAGCFQNTFGGGTSDAFLVKFGSAGNRLWGTYFGRTGNDAAYGLNTNTSDIAFSGETNGTLPAPSVASTLNGAAGTRNAFIAKFNSAGAASWNTIQGGSGIDLFEGLAFDVGGNIIVAGMTYSNNFPVLNGNQMTYGGGATDAMIVKFAPNGTTLWSTFLGGTAEEEGWDVEIDAYNNIIVVGDTYSDTSATFHASSCAPQRRVIGLENQYIIKYYPDGTKICMGIVGGMGHDDIYRSGVMCFHNGIINITGSVAVGYPTTPGAFQTTYGGGPASSFAIMDEDAIVVQMCANVCGVKKPPVDFVANQTTICRGQTIDFTDITNICDTSGATYSWYFQGATPATSTVHNPTGILYSASGTFPVTLIIHSMCSDDTLTKNAYITVNGPDIAINNFTNVSCKGLNNGSITTITTGGTGTYQYQWSPFAGTASSVSNVAPGSYTVVVSDGSGCTDSTSATITEPTLLNAFIPAQSDVSCFGLNNGSASGAATGGTSPYNYQWSNSQNSLTASNLIAGVYTLTITDSNGCTALKSATITEPQLLTVNLTQQQNVNCYSHTNGNAAVSANGGTLPYTYIWNNAQTNNIITNLGAGIYSVTVTDTYGCNAELSVTITEPNDITYNTNTLHSHCNQADGSISLATNGGTPNYNYNWSNTQTNATATGLVAGVYTVTITDANGCTKTISETVNNLSGVTAVLQSSLPASCFNSCDGQASVNGNGGTAPYNFAWNTPVLQNTAGATGLCAGIYTATVTDQEGCYDTIAINIHQPTAINIIINSTATKCFNGSDGSANAIVSGGTSGYNYSWSNGETNSSVTGLSANNYNIIITDANGCTSSSAFIITSPSAITANITGITTICAGGSTTLSSTVTGGTPGYLYNWSNGQLTQTIQVSPTASGIYSLSITDANGCIQTATDSITVNALPVVSFTADSTSGCGSLCVNFLNTSPNTQQAQWIYGNNTANNGNLVNQCFHSAGSYSVKLIITDNNGCTNYLEQNNFITIHANPIARFNANPNPVTLVNSTVYFTDQSVGATNWSWLFGDVSNSASAVQNPSFTYIDSGHYEVRLIVTNNFGCKDTATDIIKVLPDYTVYIPNTFTPNNDGLNDVFNPSFSGIQSTTYELLIFDRWGEMIFQSLDPAISWDGRANNGKDIAQQDTYIWELRVKDIFGNNHRKVGHINLIK